MLEMSVRREVTDYRFMTTTLEAWRAMLTDCRQASRSIFFEQYILSNDEWGRRFLNVFLKKAKQGVEVTLILDFIGSMDVRHSPIIEKIRAHGGIVKFYRPLGLSDIFRPNQWFPRTHMKCMIIDGSIGYIGSGCVAKRMEDWRDTYLRSTGPLVDKMMRSCNIEGHSRTPGHDNHFKVRLHKALLRRNPVYKELLHYINSAEQSICIVTPYLIAPKKLSRDLAKAVKRGVKVTLLSSRKTDVPLADLAARADFEKHLRAGIEIYLYEPSVLHTKYVIIDGKWATIGSTNIDYLSLFRNRESNISTTEAEAISLLESHFRDDLAQSTRIDIVDVQNMGLFKKLAAKCAKALKKIL